MILILSLTLSFLSCSFFEFFEQKEQEKEEVDESEDQKPEDKEETMKKSIKLLIFGNSYGNDAAYYLDRMLRCGGYEDITIGHVGESSMAINDHYHNIDDDPTNDYIYNDHPFSVHHKKVNGKKVDLPADYKAIVADEDWDYVLFYQGPNSAAMLTEREYYSECDRFISALRENMTNPEGKIIYYMTWAHNVSDTTALYNGIVNITREVITDHPEIDGVLPAATLIQNLRTSYLIDGKAGDITRDWGHLNYGVGRYAMAMLWYVYLTGGSVEDIDFMPTLESEYNGNPEYAEIFTDVDESNVKIIKEAIANAMTTPYSVTESQYKTAP